jgi:hypothetical protein
MCRNPMRPSVVIGMYSEAKHSLLDRAQSRALPDRIVRFVSQPLLTRIAPNDPVAFRDRISPLRPPYFDVRGQRGCLGFVSARFP